MPRKTPVETSVSYKPVYESESESDDVYVHDEDSHEVVTRSNYRHGDFYDNADDDSRKSSFGSMLQMTPGSDQKQASQLTTVKRQLSYKMSNISQRANGWWDTIKSQISMASEEDLQIERMLLARLNEITANSYIGVPCRKIIRTVGPGSQLGFQIGSAEHLRGARVSSITANGPAAAAGLELGDVVVAIGGKNALGLSHEEVIEMVTTSNAFDTELDITVAPPLDVPIPGEVDGKEISITPPPKPPSYVVVRNKLVEEFGEEVYGRCKKKVQLHMEQLATRFDTMSGYEPTKPPSLTSKLAVAGANTLENVKCSVKRYVGSRLSSSSVHSSAAFDNLEKEDQDSLIAARADIDENKLLQLLDKFLMTMTPLEEYSDAFAASRPGDKGLLGLSYSGIRHYLIAETNEACFERNKAYVQGKLQERELLRLSYGSRTTKPAEIAEAGAFDGAEMMVSV